VTAQGATRPPDEELAALADTWDTLSEKDPDPVAADVYVRCAVDLRMALGWMPRWPE
jgi:hypothetical protein